MNQGLILTRNWRDADAGVELEFWLRGPSGGVQLIIPGQQGVFFVPEEQLADLRACLGSQFDYELRDIGLMDFEQTKVFACYFKSQRQLRRARDLLVDHELAPLEADINPAERYLMERFVSGSLEYSDEHPPRIRPSEFKPELKVVSVDIETAMAGVELYSIGVYAFHNNQRVEKVFMVGDGASLPFVETYASERALLAAFCDWVQAFDPDVFIGWNVVNFDMWFLQRLADKLETRLALGRDRRQPHWRELNDDGERRTIALPGRVVLDGIELLRTATYRFESFSLENVSRQLLGDGKLLHGSGKGEQIGELFHTNKDALAKYNLHDCELVWAIFEHTKLMDFAIARSQMTGLNMDRLGGSVAAFDHLYLPRLHRAGYVAPNASKETPNSPGGFVMDSQPGIFDHVLVLDFKSLYPSIIRTFCIDPMGLSVGLTLDDDSPDLISGFDGGVFSRKQHLLPSIIQALWQRRDQAKERGDDAQSQAIKIIMNSFYGVLGTPACRFFDGRLASSITRRGHQIIQQTRDKIEEMGDTVIYGDTDSVFVWIQSASSSEEARERGRHLQAELNAWWRHRLREEYKTDSILELEFETHFTRFLMPTVRGSDVGSKKRYAGVVEKNGEPELVFKGLENVRTDWTMLARRFQRELYRRIFFEEPYIDYVKEVSRQLYGGELDDDLVYRKRLRHRLDDYVRNVPPHVQAARLARPRGAQVTTRGDWVEYIMTLAGAEPLGFSEAALDYDHYAERQLAPVADGILYFVGTSFREITDAQFSLF